MLVLQRSCGQSIQIGKDIKVIILRKKDGTVAIGIEAPKRIKILRSELITKSLIRRRLSHVDIS